MNLRIIKAGVLDTVQDLGRNGWQHLGINPGGVMDKLSAQVANSLVGNDVDDAVIELHFPSSTFFFERPVLLAVTGADFTATVNGEEIPLLTPVVLSRYSILQFHGLQAGARAYLAIHGGLEIEPWLGSFSTQLKASAGGFNGRALMKDDEIKLGCTKDFTPMIGDKEFVVLPWKTNSDWGDTTLREILVLPGNDWDWLADSSKEKFLRRPFTVTSRSDRMGYWLKGEKIATTVKDDLVSSAVSFGTIQLLPDGQLIILMADHQTAGGYPRLAHVISAHHSRVAQMKPGEFTRFRFTDQLTAEKLLVQQQQHLKQLQIGCKLKLETILQQYL